LFAEREVCERTAVNASFLFSLFSDRETKNRAEAPASFLSRTSLLLTSPLLEPLVLTGLVACDCEEARGEGRKKR